MISTHEDRIARIDTETGQRHGRQQWIGQGATDIARDGKMIWIAERRRRALMALSADSGRMLRFPRTPDAVDPRRGGPERRLGRRAHELEGPAELYRFDPDNLEQPLAVHDFPDGITAITLGGGYLWIALEREARVMRIRATPRSSTGRGSTRPRQSWPTAPAICGRASSSTTRSRGSIRRRRTRTRPTTRSARSRSWSHATASGPRAAPTTASSVINPRTTRQRGQLRVPPNPYGIAPSRGHVWVTGMGAGTLTRIDL